TSATAASAATIHQKYAPTKPTNSRTPTNWANSLIGRQAHPRAACSRCVHPGNATQIALLQRGVDQRAPAVVRLDEKLLVVVIVGGAEGHIEQVRADLGDDEQPLGRGLATAVLYDDAAACSESGNT